MVAPPPSKLDNRQMLQGAYDEANGLFRTSAQATVLNASIDVNLDSATGDNVFIKSSTGNELKINTNGSTDVNSVDLGVKADTPATTDTGSFSVISFIKRGMQNWTTLLSRIPVLGQALTSASIPVTMASNQPNINITENGDILSTNNASTTPLGIGGSYTGTGDDLTQFEAAMVSVVTDQNGTLFIEYSQDNSTWAFSQVYTITNATPGIAEGHYFQAMKEARYLRIRYINGAVAQLIFQLQIILNKTVGVGEVQALDQQLIHNTDALVTKGVIWGLTTGGGGGYVPVKVAPSGALTVDASNSTGLSGTFVATQPTAANLNATVVGTVTANAGTNLNTSALNLETTQAAISAKLPATLGQKVMSSSLAVAIASDQSPVATLGTLLTSASNSSVTPLTANSTFTGTVIDTSGYSSVAVGVYSDVASATDGIKIEYSWDGTNWDEATLGTFTPGTGANIGQVYGGNLRARYLRVLYTNGASNQTTFRLSTILRTVPISGDIVDMEATIGNNSHGIITKSVITGKTTAGGGAFVDVKVNPSGTLTVDTTGSIIAPTVTTSKTTVGLTAVRATVAGTAPNSSRRRFRVRPTTGNTGKIFIGNSGVTITTGYEITATNPYISDFDAGDYYVISDTAAQSVEILEGI